MSAWMVSTRHIDCLVSAMGAFGIVGRDEYDRIGDILVQENVESLLYRYSRDKRSDYAAPGTYRHTPFSSEDPAFILKQVDCYDYQACEHPGWEESEASRLCNLLVEKIAASIGHSPSEIRMTPAWDAALWGVD
jgi:hypothetical protein